MKKLKPGYNPEEIQGQLVDKVCEYFDRVYNDAEQERLLSLRGHRPGDEAWQKIMHGLPTINETAEEFNVTPAKIRKILVTGGYYDTALYRSIMELRTQGLGAEEIAEKIGKKKVTVQSYLPYEKVIYMMEERSVNADRVRRFKERWGGYKKPSLLSGRRSGRHGGRSRTLRANRRRKNRSANMDRI